MASYHMLQIISYSHTVFNINFIAEIPCETHLNAYLAKNDSFSVENASFVQQMDYIVGKNW